METLAKHTNDFYFLRGGGEMGAMIRAKDWSQTALGDPKDWPQSLCTMVAMMLDNPFGMYIAWGNDYIQLYNDGYRPILGSTKHPNALGTSSSATFEEIWHIIGPMFQGVMNGKAVGFPDFMLPLNRNGFVEECCFDFSYSPIRKDNGEVGGVLVTVIETTDKKKAIDALKESEIRFRQITNSLPLIVWTASPDGDLTYISNQWETFYGNPVRESLGTGWITYVHPDDIEEAGRLWKHALHHGTDYETEFRVRYRGEQYQWILVRAIAIRNQKGEVISWNGSNTNIQDKKLNEEALQKSEQEVRSMVENAPFPIGVYTGKNMCITLANQAMLDVWGKGNDVIGKHYRDILPELQNQQVFQQLDAVFTSGVPFHAKNQRLDLLISGRLQPFYFNYSFTPLFDTSGNVYGVMNTAADVTDLNMATFKIQESENKLRNTILQAPVAMCIFMGPDHIVELANERMYELWGKPAEAFLNKPLFEGLFEAKNQGFEELLDSVYHTGKTVAAEKVPVTLPRNGVLELVYVNILYQAYRDTNGTITGILAVAIDITPQVIAHKKIEEAEEKARLAIHSAELGVYDIVYATDEMNTDTRFKEIWGIPHPVSRNEYAAAIHPDDLLQRKEAHEISLKTGHLNYQARVIWQDTSVHWLRITGKVLYDAKGCPSKLIGIAQDITAAVTAREKIEESEKNIRNIILQAPVAMCILRGPSHVVEIANNRMFELWGKQESEVMHKPVFEGLPESKEQGLEQLLHAVFTTGERFVANEMPVNLPRNGKIETVYINFVYEALTKVNDYAGVLVVAIDVTPQVIARQKIEEVVEERTKDLANANKDLQKSNSELAQFAYIASHDLQEPLRKISTFSQMLEDSLGNELKDTSRNYLDRIKNSSSRMNKLIRDVLTYSELVKENELFVAVDLNDVMENIKNDYDLLIAQKEATVNYSGLPVIEAIPLQMSQLFGNMLGNALKFARKDVKPVITITATKIAETEPGYSASDKNTSYYKIQFTDNGIGIKPEYTQQIFNIFQRLHRKSEYEGTGIGLAMCKKIALNHHGDLNANGSAETGAVFNIILPAKQTSNKNNKTVH